LLTLLSRLACGGDSRRCVTVILGITIDLTVCVSYEAMSVKKNFIIAVSYTWLVVVSWTL